MQIIHREFLPSVTNAVHAATIEFWEGHPVFAWFGGTREGCADVCIYLYNFDNAKETVKIGNRDDIPRWNPILVGVNKDLFLFEKAGGFCDRWSTFIYNLSECKAAAEKRSPKRELIEEIIERQTVLPAGLNGPVKSKPLVNVNELCCGSSVETMYDWTSYIEIYDVENGALSFCNRSNPLTVPKVKYENSITGKESYTMGIIQPTIWQENGNLFAFFRSSRGLGRIYYSECMCKETNLWSSPVETNLDNPNSAVDVVYMDGSLYLVWNPDQTNRFPLVISKIKRNSTERFNFDIIDTLVVEIGVNRSNYLSKGCNSPELSYPYMISNGGKLHLVYTYGRSKIEYCVINVN